MVKCQQCGSTRKGDEFVDGTGYECPEFGCFSNVYYDEGSAAVWLLVAPLVVMVVMFAAQLAGAMAGVA